MKVNKFCMIKIKQRKKEGKEMLDAKRSSSCRREKDNSFFFFKKKLNLRNSSSKDDESCHEKLCFITISAFVEAQKNGH